MAQTALSQVALEQIIWVPTHCPPHKLAAKFEHRWEMVHRTIAPWAQRRAIADHPAFTISPVGENSSSSTYAIQTLIDLQAFYSNTRWYWIVGLDTFQTLPRWYRRQELVPMCEWLVVPRSRVGESGVQGEYECQQVVLQLSEQGIGIHWQLLQMPLVGISSSLIRQYCREGVSIRYLVPEVVRIYIDTHNLYTATG